MTLPGGDAGAKPSQPALDAAAEFTCTRHMVEQLVSKSLGSRNR